MKEVVIRGGGVAACCSARLLCAAGIRVTVETAGRTHVPALMLSQATQNLIRDFFDKDNLFRGLPQIEKRVVAWGPDAKPLMLPHSAVIISELQLSDRLRTEIVHDKRDDNDAVDKWSVLASRPLPPPSIDHHFGTRVARAVAVELNEGCDANACWVESLKDGWLFLVPGSGKSAWLLSVGSAAADSQLANSRLVADQIAALDHSTAEFPAYPRIADPLCAPGWLACGSAALAFDPLCGDGTGHAVREAILAAAVIRAAAPGANIGDLLAHYRARLVLGFKRHLELCRQFYATGNAGPWWDVELDHILRGIEWCEGQLRREVKFRYQLNGFELQEIP